MPDGAQRGSDVYETDPDGSHRPAREGHQEASGTGASAGMLPGLKAARGGLSSELKCLLCEKYVNDPSSHTGTPDSPKGHKGSA